MSAGSTRTPEEGGRDQGDDDGGGGQAQEGRQEDGLLRHQRVVRLRVLRLKQRVVDDLRSDVAGSQLPVLAQDRRKRKHVRQVSLSKTLLTCLF